MYLYLIQFFSIWNEQLCPEMTFDGDDKNEDAILNLIIYSESYFIYLHRKAAIPVFGVVQ